MVGRPVVWPLRWDTEDSQSSLCTGHSNPLELEVCRRVKPPRTSVKLWRRLQSGSRSKKEIHGLVCCLNTSQELIIPWLGCPGEGVWWSKTPKTPNDPGFLTDDMVKPYHLHSDVVSLICITSNWQIGRWVVIHLRPADNNSTKQIEHKALSNTQFFAAAMSYRQMKSTPSPNRKGWQKSLVQTL